MSDRVSWPGRMAQVVLDVGARFQFRVSFATTNPASNPPKVPEFAPTR